MAIKPALTEGELHSRNYRSIHDWIEKNRARIKAAPSKTVLYSGRDYDFDFKEGMTEAEIRETAGTPMFKRIQELRKSPHDASLPVDFQTLEEVLAKIKDHPAVVDKDCQEQRFANAHDFFDSLTHPKLLAALVPDPRKLQDQCWKRLSEIYASNAQGDIAILDGAADDYGRLNEHKIYLQKELPALLKNDKLSPAAKKLLQKKVSAYCDHFDRRYTALLAQLDDGMAQLKRKRR